MFCNRTDFTDKQAWDSNSASSVMTINQIIGLR